MKIASMLILLFLLAGGFKEHEFAAEFVSADAPEHTITFRPDGDDMDTTLSISGKAAEKVKDLSSGDRVILTCLDDYDGQHLGIIDIKK